MQTRVSCNPYIRVLALALAQPHSGHLQENKVVSIYCIVKPTQPYALIGAENDWRPSVADCSGCVSVYCTMGSTWRIMRHVIISHANQLPVPRLFLVLNLTLVSSAIASTRTFVFTSNRSNRWACEGICNKLCD